LPQYAIFDKNSQKKINKIKKCGRKLRKGLLGDLGRVRAWSNAEGGLLVPVVE